MTLNFESKVRSSYLVAGAALLAVAVASGGCGKKEPVPSAAEDTPSATTEAPTTKDRSKFSGRSNSKLGAQMNPTKGQLPIAKLNAIPTYPEDGIAAIDANCTDPWTILARAPKPDSDKAFAWPIQSLYANPHFRLGSTIASAGEVMAEVHEASSELVFAVRCHDAGTCRRVAAMYKAVSRGDAPKTGCGALPDGLSNDTKRRTVEKRRGEEALGPTDDPIAMCARIGACMTAQKPGGEDVGHACEKAPSSFKTACARESSCAAIAKCLEPSP
jgi:hypothetical protein